MTKRRAESDSSFCPDPEKKRCRSACSADSALVCPPPLLQPPAVLDSRLRCRKRSSRSEPLESLPEPKKAPPARAASLRTSADSTVDCSGKVRDESGAQRSAELQDKQPRGEKKPLKTPSTPEINKVMQGDGGDDDDDDDNLCTFNSFQFWRVPLPEVDLSLLDSPSNGDTGTKDSEEMET